MPLTLDKRQLLKSFNRAAATYQQAIAIPEVIGLRLLERLDIMRLQPQLVLEVGCANGYLSHYLAERYKNAAVFGVDFAVNLLLSNRQAVKPPLVCADAYQLPFPTHSADLIFSNLMPAWCDDLTGLFAEFKRVLKPQGLLLFTTPGPDTLQELRQCWAMLDAAHPHVHAFVDMHNIGDILVQAKFADPVMDMEKLTIEYPDLAALMVDLKALGMHNMTCGRKRGLSTPRQFARLNEYYDNHRLANGKLPATLEVIYGHARAPDLIESSVNEAGDVIIPISKIKRKHI